MLGTGDCGGVTTRAPASTWKTVVARHGGVVAARLGLWHWWWSTSSATVVDGEVLGFGFLVASE